MAEDEKQPAEEAMGEARLHQDFETLCAELNMDQNTGQEAWKSYLHTRLNYTLEGDQLHWLACALYVACRKTSVETVGKQMMEGNGVSLTRLLRSCQLSLIQFFSKARSWADMNNLQRTIVDKIDKLERNFAVSNVIFKKYQPIFVDLFKDPSLDPPKLKTSRKQKRPPCTPGDVFDFCWSLFILVKSRFPSISDDLVNSYHLLLSCVDYVYANAVLDQRTDLLNQNFNDETPEGAVPCILDKLCTMHDGLENEVKSIREHFFKPYIKKLFEEKVLRGDMEHLCGILDRDQFEINFKNIRKDYEAYVLSIGEYDERVFLGEDAPEEIGTPAKVLHSGGGRSGGDSAASLSERIGVARRNLENQFGGSSLIPGTPLSGRHYLRAREQQLCTPVTNATYLVTKLNKMVAGKRAEPGPELLALFTTYGGPDVEQAVKARVQLLADMFTARYTAPTETHPGSQASFAAMRLKMGQILFYRVLEKVLVAEVKKSKSIGALLDQTPFHQALFTACLEVVIFSYNSQRTFPWLLQTFNLEAFHFYKVIEVIIRNEEGLARDVVKHLQRIEEQILESRAWAASSPLWEAIRNCEGGVPSCEDASIPSQEQLMPPGQSPLSHHKSYVIRSPMAGDRFKSPVVTHLARRQLFSVGAGQSVLASQQQQQQLLIPTSTAAAGQSLLLSPVKLLASGSPLRLPPTISPMKPTTTAGSATATVGGGTASVGGKPPRKTGSVGLFFRKLYHIAYLRLENLCNSMQLMDEEIKRRIWTCLEYTVRNHTELMKDRHLDQLIMCSLYIVCKVSGRAFEKNFTDIMKHYRNQPQAASHVYRSVLLKPKAPPPSATGDAVDQLDGEANKIPAPSVVPGGNSDSVPSNNRPPPTPTRMAAKSTVGEDGSERGDIICFYNTVYMEKMQEYAMLFRRMASQPPLSPLPQLRASAASSPCRKVSDHHSVFTRPLRPNSTNIQFTSPLSYSFNKSPRKDLEAINEMVRSEAGRPGRGVGKRLRMDLGDGEEGAPAGKILISYPVANAGGATAAAPRTTRMVEMLLGERAK